jgi:ATP-dependent helicase/nuclease subunit A
VVFPRRILPHQLAQKPDLVRMARHESAVDEAGMDAREDPLEYGVWWHETVEFVPWSGPAKQREEYLRAALQAAGRRGFAERGAREIELLQKSGLWAEFTSGDWEIFAELSVMAPLGAGEWVDGVIDLVAQKRTTGELLVVDWKTNQRRMGEGDQPLLERLAGEYRPQLQAYANCLAGFFPQQRISWSVYSTSAGALVSG